MLLGEISIVTEAVNIYFKECDGHRMFSIFLGVCSTETWLVSIGLGTGMAPSRWPAIALTKDDLGASKKKDAVPTT